MTIHRHFLRHLLLSRSDWMEARVFAAAERNGYGEVTVAMNRLFAHLGGRPMGLSELARRLSVSRQAVYKLALDAERLGLVEFVTSEKDARVKLLRYTHRGWDMSESAAAEFARIEADIARTIGEDRLEQLRELLSLPWSAEEAEEGARRG